MHKSGLKLLESYEDLKKSYDRLNEAWKEKKHKLDEVWNLDRVYREQISTMSEECKKLTNLIAEINLGKAKTQIFLSHFPIKQALIKSNLFVSKVFLILIS